VAAVPSFLVPAILYGPKGYLFFLQVKISNNFQILFFIHKKRHEIVDFTLVNIFDYINLHWDPFGSGSESEWFDRIRILQNVRILSDLDLDSDPQHWLGSLHCKYLLILESTVPEFIDFPDD